ncbi:MAG: D-alanyl-D-alanine carboxypeptidase family protein [Rhizomicrobium sp.]|jgi:D-alanyl-D-alanine carboxypeptidase
MLRTKPRRAWSATYAAAAAGLLLAISAAQPSFARHHHLLTDPDLDAELVVDAATGKVLFARNDTAARHPASLTKMMTLYLLFESLASKKLSLQGEIAVSDKAASQPRSHMRLRAGSTISVEMAVKGIVVCSANDAAVAAAEAIGGSEQHFTELMNAKAHELGMTHTFYHNASGLPDGLQLTTAGDLAILAKHLIYDFPQFFPYFATRSLTWRGENFNTHNMLIGNYPGADGLKTGYIDASGYNLVATAMRDKTRLIAVVMGGLTAERRDERTVDLLDDAFAQEKANMVASSAAPAAAPAEGISQQRAQTTPANVTN